MLNKYLMYLQDIIISEMTETETLQLLLTILFLEVIPVSSYVTSAV